MTSLHLDPNPRAGFIAQLRNLADLLERYPALPFDEFDRADAQHSVLDGDEATRVAEVERVAAILGVDVERRDRVVRAVLDLGQVRYVIAAGTDLGDALYDAAASYRGAVEPDLAGVA